MRVLFQKLVVERHLGERDRVTFAFSPIPKAVKDDQCEWAFFVLQFGLPAASLLYELAWNFVPQTGHCRRFLTPLIGSTGMMKKSVMKRIPFFIVKFPTVPHLPQRICSGTACEPHEKKCVPTIKKNEIIPSPRVETSNRLPVIRALVHVWIGPFHPALRPMQLDETKSLIQSMRILRRQNPATKALQLLMRNDDFHQPLRQTSPAMFRQDKNVGHPGECRIVSDDARESDLLAAFVDAKRK